MQKGWRVNVLGTARVVEAAEHSTGARLVHISSVRVYSDTDFPDLVDETWPVRPDGHVYVDTKVASEQVALQAHAEGRVRATVVRPGDVYGPGSVPWTIWPATGIPTGTFVLPTADGTFSPAYVDNLVPGIALAAGDAGAGLVFNLSDGVAVSNREFFGHYARMTDVQLPVVGDAEARAVLDAAGIGADTVDYFHRTGTYSIERARSVLGYEPAIPLPEGMEHTERWLRDSGLLG